MARLLRFALGDGEQLLALIRNSRTGTSQETPSCDGIFTARFNVAHRGATVLMGKPNCVIESRRSQPPASRVALHPSRAGGDHDQLTGIPVRAEAWSSRSNICR